MTGRSPSRVGDEPGAASAALALAARGWPVFPVAGKVPRTGRGCLDATTDATTVRRWFERIWPDAGVAVATGRGLVVLDVDGDDGADSLHELERAYAPLPDTVRATTARGMHHYFATKRNVANSAGRLGEGLDVRGRGGYVVAPPSPHPSGGRYEWDIAPGEADVAPAPAWLLALTEHASAPHKPTPASEWVAMLRDGIPDGRRNQALARLTGHLLARHVDRDVTAELVALIAEHRCKPPLPADEARRVFVSIAGRESAKREREARA